MKCPSCRFEQPDERVDCECCGLIFAKWRERHAPPVPEAEVPEALVGPQTPEEEEPDGAGLPESPRGDRFYDFVADSYFQRNPKGGRFYYPWGALGRGYPMVREGLESEIRRTEARFAAIHIPFLVLLATTVLCCVLFSPDGQFQKFLYLDLYLVLSYGWFWWRSRRWTAALKASRRTFDHDQYVARLKPIFHWKVLLGPEMLSLFLALAGMWMWLSGEFPILFEKGLLIQRVWLAFSLSLLLGTTLYHYFIRRPRD